MKLLKCYFAPVFDEEKEGEDRVEKKEDMPTLFTQEQLNTAVAKERRESEAKSAKRIKDLSEFRDKANLSQEELDSVNQQLEAMKSEHKTKDQLAVEETTRSKKQHDKQITDMTGDRDLWQGRYTKMRNVNSITNASVTHDAHNPEQVVAILEPSTRLVEALDENGKKTGQFEPKTKFTGIDEDGKEIELDISPEEAVKRMVDMDKYYNLFKGNKTGGLGADKQNRGGDGTGDLKNTANYMKQRKAGKLGLNK